MSTVNGEPAASEARLPVLIPKGATQDILLLAALWFASLVVVNPLGDFPLNDDWSFGLAVKNLLQTGSFHPTGWTSMPLITQTIWGALFCLPGGFSFTALRCSTLALCFCSMLAVYLLIRQVHLSRLLATVAALTVAFNPIYYALSNTFMTDVPFTAFLLMAAFSFCRYLQGGSDFALLCGLACALAATLCRQLGLAAPVAFAACLLGYRGFAGRWLVRALLPLVVCLGALLTFQHWLTATGRMPTLYSLKNGELFSALFMPKRMRVGPIAKSRRFATYSPRSWPRWERAILKRCRPQTLCVYCAILQSTLSQSPPTTTSMRPRSSKRSNRESTSSSKSPCA